MAVTVSTVVPAIPSTDFAVRACEIRNVQTGAGCVAHDGDMIADSQRFPALMADDVNWHNGRS